MNRISFDYHQFGYQQLNPVINNNKTIVVFIIIIIIPLINFHILTY